MLNQSAVELNTSAIIPFSYESEEIRVIKDEAGNPWWIAKDVCDVLSIVWKGAGTLGPLDDDEKNVQIMDTAGGSQELWTINESGLYTLIVRSNKPEAKKFRKWVTSEVLPQIRQTEMYRLKSLDNLHLTVPLRSCEQQHDATLGVKQLFLFVQSKISALWGRYPKGPEITIMWLFAPLRRVLFLEVQHV